MEKLLPAYCFILWLVDLCYSHIQTDQIVGIAGNKNWHASSLIFLTIFGLCLLIRIFVHLRSKKRKATPFAFFLISASGIFLLIYSAYFFYICKCTASYISISGVTMLFGYLIIRERWRTASKYIAAAFFSLIVIVSLYCIIIETTPALRNPFTRPFDLLTERILWRMENDVRLPLWQGCLNLSSKHLITGVGSARFESEYESFRPINYFLMPDNAVRSNHPHNSILYILACYGIFGLIAWGILWIYPMVHCLINFYSLSSFYKAVLFVYICLFLNGLLDLIFYEWPTLFYSGILIGLLWARTWSFNTGTEGIPSTSKIVKYISSATASVIVALTALIAYNEAASSNNFRIAMMIADSPDRNPPAELSYINKGLRYKLEPKYIYKAAITSLYDLNNPGLALEYLNDFNRISLSEYAHKNGFISLALLKLNKPKEALPYLTREAVNYPALTASWHRLAMVQKKLGMNEQAKIALSNMLETLKLKGLSPKAIPLLLANPDYDSHPEKIPGSELDSIRAPKQFP